MLFISCDAEQAAGVHPECRTQKTDVKLKITAISLAKRHRKINSYVGLEQTETDYAQYTDSIYTEGKS